MSTKSAGASGLLIVLAAGTFSDVALERARVGRRATVEIADLSSTIAVSEATKFAHAVIVTNNPLPSPFVAALGPNMRLIVRAGIGLDAIDIDAVAARGLALMNLPAYATEDVATHAVALMLAAVRRLKDADQAARSCWADWRSVGQMRSIEESTVGIVGCGRIGRAVIRRLAPFAKSIIVYDPLVASVPRPARRIESLDKLLIASDIVSLHLPLTPETRNLLSTRELGLLRPGAIVVNVARGALVDQVALAAALSSGYLGGAALDVLDPEPPQPSDPIFQAPNTFVTPHIGWYSMSSERRVREEAIDDALSFLTDRRVRHGSFVTGGPPAAARR